jgi:capsular polysaccharide biosynthesis protein
MPITEYFRILWRRGWILALMAVLTAAAAFAFSRMQTPVYKATMYILVKPSRPDFGLTQSAKILLRNYVAWMDTDNRAREVIDALQLDKEPQALRGDVTIASDDSRFVIQIDAENENQQLASQVANQWALLFLQWRDAENNKQRREDWVAAEILDAPRISLDRPNTRINTVAGAVLGVVLGGVIVFFLEYLGASVIRSSADIERQFGMAVLGAIPAAERKR